MGVIVPTDDYQMSMIWTNDLTSKEFTVSLGFTYSGFGGAPTATELADAFYDTAVDSGHPCDDAFMAIGWTFEGISGFLQTAGGPILGAHLDSVNGSGSDNDVPVNCAILLQKQTASGGRRNRGRLFVPPIVAGLTTDTNGQLLAGDVTNLEDGFNNMLPDFVTANVEAVIHHSDGGPGTVITGFAGSQLLATQRKRMR
jgi:hypothetical protein